MQMQVPPAPMARYARFPPMPLPEDPQQPGPGTGPAPGPPVFQVALGQLQHQHQAWGELGAGPDEILFVTAAVAAGAGPGHFSLNRDPDADLGALNALDYPSFTLPSSVSQEVLRPLTNPAHRPVRQQQPVRQPAHFAPQRSAPRRTASLPVPFTLHSLFLSTLSPSLPLSLSRALSHPLSPAYSRCLVVRASGNRRHRLRTLG